MRRFLILLAASLFLAGPADAFSFQSGTESPFDPPFWADIYVGYASVTSDVTIGTPNSGAVRQNLPSSFFLQTIFSTTAGPLNSNAFNGVVNQTLSSAGTSTQQVDITGTIIGNGPGGADDPIFKYTISPGASIFVLNAGYATLNPALGSISVFQQASFLDGLAGYTLSQNGSNLDGSFVFTDGSASRTIQFRTSSDFDVVYLSPGVSAVPLPPALPMFASALAALGFLALRQRSAARRAALA